MPAKAPSHPIYQPKTRAEWRAWLAAQNIKAAHYRPRPRGSEES